MGEVRGSLACRSESQRGGSWSVGEVLERY